MIQTSGQYKIAGILDSRLKTGSTVAGVSVLGDDEKLAELFDDGIKNACIAVGSIRNNSTRRSLFEKVKQIGFKIPHLIHPESILTEGLHISEGVQIMAGAVIQTGSSIGENTIINTGSIIEHDCEIGRHVHICPGTVISGGCDIGDEAFIGVGAIVIQGIKIGINAVVAAGAVVIRDVPDNSTVIGVPAK